MSKKQLRIIGLAGTNGSGKDTVGKLLSKQHNYLFVSVTDLLRAELKRRKLDVSRENLRTLSAEWRLKQGLGVLVDMALSTYKAAAHNYAGLVIGSLRNSGEVDRVHDLGGTVVWVDAQPRIRYNRIQRNAALRGRADEDNKSYDQFLAEEATEMHRPIGADSTVLNMLDVKKASDVFLENNRDDVGSLKNTLDKALGL